MALFTDGPPATIDDLRRYDSSTDEVARDSRIDLDAKLSVAAEEIGEEILDFLLFQGTPQTEAARQRIGLSDVVVTASLKRWHAMRALADLYRDAYGADVSDRFRKKWEDYEKLAEETAEYVFTTGIGLARDPVEQAPLAVVAQADETSSRADFTIQIAWVSNGGAEGAPSEALPVQLAPGDRILAPAPAPPRVTGWNLYLGAGQQVPMLQNDSPIPVDVLWTVPAGASRSGQQVPRTTIPDFRVVERRILQRG